MTWVLLCVAIAAEVAATSNLPRTKQFRRPGPSVVVTMLYLVAFVCLARVVQTIEVGVAYALWAGLGTTAVAAIGMAFLQERVTVKKIVGLVCIVVGVVVLNLAGSHT